MKKLIFVLMMLAVTACGTGVDKKYKEGQSCTFLHERVVIVNTQRYHRSYEVVFPTGNKATVPENQLSNCYY